jgi:hypothetical protein
VVCPLKDPDWRIPGLKVVQHCFDPIRTKEKENVWEVQRVTCAPIAEVQPYET